MRSLHHGSSSLQAWQNSTLQAAWCQLPVPRSATLASCQIVCSLIMGVRSSEGGAAACITKKRSLECCWCAGVDLVWELPPNRHTACTLQIQLSDKSPQAVNKATHKSWASEYGVICLGGSSTFFTIDGADEPQFWPPDGLRAALKPSGDLRLLPHLCCNPLCIAASAESTQRHPILSTASAVQCDGNSSPRVLHCILCAPCREALPGTLKKTCTSSKTCMPRLRCSYLCAAEVYKREVEKMLEEVERQFGTREFKGVHVRVEPDWEQQCAGAQNRTDPSSMLFNNKHQCWVTIAPLLISHARFPCM